MILQPSFQIPRIDITSPANAIEYHPALLSHLEDGGRGGAGSIPANSAQAMAPTMPIVSQIPDSANSINSESDSDLSELSDDNISIGSLRAAELESELVIVLRIFQEKVSFLTPTRLRRILQAITNITKHQFS